MKTTPFSEYALSSGLSADEIYTIELLIDYVEYDLDPKYRNRETDFGEARFKPDYQPHFSRDVAIPAGIALQKLSFQSDDVKEEFVVWIYPDKIMVTKEHEKTVRKLIKPN